MKADAMIEGGGKIDLIAHAMPARLLLEEIPSELPSSSGHASSGHA
jgi:hypothetical protein